LSVPAPAGSWSPATTLNGLSEDDLAVFRRKTLGIVFQSFHLIPSLSALDNVGLALEIANPDLTLAQTREAATAALTAVGLGDRLDHRPSALSGGEQQRVGLARAMIAKPRLLLADEPTGNLDQKTGAMVIELMFDLARQQGTAVVLITHDPALAARADRVFTMTQGQLTETAVRRHLMRKVAKAIRIGLQGHARRHAPLRAVDRLSRRRHGADRRRQFGRREHRTGGGEGGRAADGRRRRTLPGRPRRHEEELALLAQFGA
jgi:predicted ABC-type transport system involved in lysophospholipase L1 biosynthesis ATPase subunit